MMASGNGDNYAVVANEAIGDGQQDDSKLDKKKKKGTFQKIRNFFGGSSKKRFKPEGSLKSQSFGALNQKQTDGDDDDDGGVSKIVVEMDDHQQISTEDIDEETIEDVRVLKSVAKVLNGDQAKKLKTIMESIAHESVREVGNQGVLIDYTRLFVNSGLIDTYDTSGSIINILIKMWNQNVARYVMKSVYNIDIGKTIVDEMKGEFPSDLKLLDDQAAEIFAKALKDGSEKVKNIRLMVVGMYGVGKTSLVNNLIKDFRNANITPESTEVINLHRCQLMDNGDWHLDTEQKKEKYESRIKNVLKEALEPPSSIDLPFDHLSLYNLSEIESDEENHESTNMGAPKPLDTFEAIQQNVKEHIHELRNAISDISDNKSAAVEKKTDITLSVWDFAGQTLYYSTHQFFLNKRSIYLVLMDMTKDLNKPMQEEDASSEKWCGLVKDCTYLDVFKFWLNAIYMYSGYRAMTGEFHPTVILVGTCKDKMVGTDEQKEDYNDDYFDRALQSIGCSPILQHIYPKKFLVNNLSPSDPVFNDIRQEIVQLAQKQDYWGEQYPVRWIKMEQALDKLRDKGKQVLNIEAIYEANRSNVPQLGKKELELFLEIQHRHGNILYFNTKQLKHSVVLAPQWIIEVFKRFITHRRSKNPKLSQDWKLYEELAILKRNVFMEIMENSQDDIKDNSEDVMKYMEHLDVMAKPFVHVESDEVEQLKACADVDLNPKFLDFDFHIMPCRLKNPTPTIDKFTSSKDPLKTPVLCFEFVDNFMPPSFFHRLVAVCVRTYSISKVGGQYLLFNGLAVFNIRNTDVLTIWYKDHIIYARISSCRKDCTDLDFEMCQEVRQTLKRSLLKFAGQSLENPLTPGAVEDKIQCPEMKQFKNNTGLFRLSDFIYNRELTCDACEDRHTVDRKHAMNYWYKNELDQLDKDDDLNQPVGGNDLAKVASEIGEEYWMLGIKLGLTIEQMKQIHVRETHDISRSTFVLKYLILWMETEGEKATQQRLYRALHAAKII